MMAAFPTQDDIRRRHEQRQPMKSPSGDYQLSEAERQEQLDLLCPPPRPLTDAEREQIVRSIRTSQALAGVEGTDEEVRAALEQAETMPLPRIGE